MRLKMGGIEHLPRAGLIPKQAEQKEPRNRIVAAAEMRLNSSGETGNY